MRTATEWRLATDEKIAAPAPPAAPMSPVPIQPAPTTGNAPDPPSDPRVDPPGQRRLPPRPPRADSPGHRAVADPDAPSNYGHATAHSLPHGAVAAATACPTRAPPPPRYDAACYARAMTDPALANRDDRALEHGPGPSMPPAQALPPANASGLPFHTKPDIPASQHRVTPLASPPCATATLRPRLRCLPPPPRAHPTRHRDTHGLVTQRGGDQGMHRDVPADTAGTATTLCDREPLRDDTAHLKRARISYPPSEGAADQPDPAADDSTAPATDDRHDPASTEAPSDTTHAGPARIRLAEGDEIRVHGQSACARILSLHPEHQVCVRWSTRMREVSTIDLADIASVQPPSSKRPRASTDATGTGPTAHRRTKPDANGRSTPTAASHAKFADGTQPDSTTAGHPASAADGHADHTPREHQDPTAGDRAAPTANDRTGPSASLHTSPDTAADARTPPPTDAACAYTEHAPNEPDAHTELPMRSGLLARTLGKVSDYAMSLMSSTGSSGLRLRWRAHTGDREQPGQCIDGTPAPPPEAPAPPEAHHPQPEAAAPTRTDAQPGAPGGARPCPPSRSSLPSGRPLPDKLADVVAATAARGPVTRPPEYVLETDAAIPMCAAIFAATCKNRATQECLLRHDAVPIPNFADTRWRTSMPARRELATQCRLWLTDAVVNADASVTDLPNHTEPTFACNAHFRLFLQPKHKGPSKPAIAPSYSPPPRRHNNETGAECRVLAILAAVATIDHHFDAPASCPMTYSYLLRHTCLIAEALARVSSFCVNTTATPIAYAAMARHGRLPGS